MFIRRQNPKTSTPAHKAHSFFRSFYSKCDLFQVNQSEKKLTQANMNITFVSEDKNFDFFLVMEGQLANAKPYYFKIQPDCAFEYQTMTEDSRLAFQFLVDSQNLDLKVRLEFDTPDQDFAEPTKFMNIFTRLMWQAKNRKFYGEAGPQFDFSTLCPQQAAPEGGAEDFGMAPAVQELFEELVESGKYEFLGVGELFSKDDTGNPIHVKGSFLLGVETVEQYVYQIQIFGEDREKIYHKEITSDLQYDVNEQANDVSWLDTKAGNTLSVLFRFKQDRTATNMLLCLQLCILQAKNEMSLEDFVKKTENKDWGMYYNQDPLEDYDEETDDDFDPMDTYKEFRDGPGRERVSFGQEHAAPAPAQQSSDFSTLGQMKTINRTFLTEGPVVQVYRDSDDGSDQLQHVVSLNPMQTKNGDHLNARKLIFTDQEKKALLLNKDASDDKVYLFDLETSQIVQEMEHPNQSTFMDISEESKDAFQTTDPTFLGCQDQNIVRLDPRLANPVASERPYKTDVGFASIHGAVGNYFAVGSQTGEIRLYDKIGGNAKNLLPSLFGHKIVSMDSSKDGEFLLAATRSFIMLVPLVQKDKNGFSFRFRKDSKPLPKILKVSPKVMARLGIEQFSFNSARFDHRKGAKESVIVATSGRYMVQWTLKRIMRGRLETTVVKAMDGEIIGNDFRYDSDKIVAALPRKVLVQSNVFK